MLENLKSRHLPPIPCLYTECSKDPAKLLIYFHGIGEDLGRIYQELETLRTILKINVLAMEYPGYGLNWYKGIATEKLFQQDALSVLLYVLENTQINMDNILLFGRSMGTGVASFLAEYAATKLNAPCQGLILKSPFRSLKQAVYSHVKVAACFVQPMFNNEENTQKVRCPILMVHGTKDTLVKIEQSQAMYKIL